MSSRVLGVFYFALIMIGLTGCKVDSIDEPIILPFVDQEFSFDLWENLNTSSGSPLEIRMYTIEEGNCLNATILSSYEYNQQELKLTLFEILEPETCDPGQAPAEGVEAINDINFGLYNLNIELQGIVTNRGELTSTSSSYKVNMDEENGIQWLHYQLLRVPNAALWGYLTYTGDEGQAKAEDFIAELEAIGSELNVQDGYYGHFEWSAATNQVKIYDMPDEGNVRPFLLRYQGDRTVLDQLVNDLRNNASDGLELVLRDQQGNEW
jgi:hypothetical protein